MDGIANVARQQQSQVSTNESQGSITQNMQDASKSQSKSSDVQEMKTATKIDSKEQVETLVSELNKAMAPLSTNLKFGVDTNDVFYVSVIDTQTSTMIRRFPAEKAESFLGKMQEVSGILFDSKG
jgi:flagellar protein FlaG